MIGNKRFFACFLILLIAVGQALADPVYHRVVRGDTLYSIARQYNVALVDLMRVNSISDPARLLVGANLLIPGSTAVAPAMPATVVPTSAGSSGTAATPVTAPAVAASPRSYVVQRGDTLYAIARSYNVSLESLRAANNLSNNTIQPSQRLTIPGTALAGGGQVAPAAATTNQAAAGSGGNAGAVAARPGETPSAAGIVVSQSGDNFFWPSNGLLVPLQGKLTGVAIQSQPGSAVQAVRAGTVVSAGPFRGFGNVAFVQAADGLMYVYGGLAMINVKVGDSIRKASRIGLLSTDSEASAYFFVFRGAETIDPAQAPRD
ncbi:MAG: hypothetical protein A2087_03880 [Spirochaetes bacterium GWD1_61_31]|nr:MAG: hypothetical protein A2Y37_05080 [Spirochaetes bacterium GWB1_60_80]OHD32471.1 MAG: hypothetical protein A2004_12100 [Spirochaetes bacterium GWC1_61_12]OHD42714.1 MAG: hypothetical protein A2087_03880 [Spirochaetes bacterium GWD1_61_31]OHD43747.1 MAG: hypothetical protein A2Y35_00270 [Spirochaetes bacterium GWE1_60_18]OHD60233.1 MAG: hypothetical protein A2Y32_07320 [Spirochaetes bacterium GWF1_60_12]